MTNRETRLLRAARSGLGYAASLCTEHPRVAGAAARLTDALARAHQAAVDQHAARVSRGQPRRSVAQCKALLLRLHLRPIATDARELLAGLPGLEASLRLERFKAPASRHLASAKRIRRIAGEHAPELIAERSYAADFLERFDDAVTALAAAARVDRGAARARYSAATREVKEQIDAVRQALAGLDVQIAVAYYDKPLVLRAWRRAKRMPAKLGRPRKRKSD